MLEHEAVHRAQWRRYGLAFIPLYVDAGQDAAPEPLRGRGRSQEGRVRVTQTIVITGASSGIGANAAATLAGRGWDVAVVGRNPERTRAVAEAVGGTPFLADYDRLDDVRALAAALDATVRAHRRARQQRGRAHPRARAVCRRLRAHASSTITSPRSC